MQTLPLFPLGTVLYPDGKLALRVFEPRYLDLVSQCVREDGTFGVCLIEDGSEVGEPARPHAVGTEARIIDWDRHDDGLLGLTVRGERRFRIVSTQARPDNLLLGEVEWLDEEPVVLPGEYSALAELLRRLLQQFDPDQAESGERFSEAGWVAYRLAEYLPLTIAQRQILLEHDNPTLRLQILAALVRSATADE
jgi:uncharacterized protein